jgi:hypothetical protein
MTGLEHQTFTLLHSKASGMGLLRLRVARILNKVAIINSSQILFPGHKQRSTISFLNQDWVRK